MIKLEIPQQEILNVVTEQRNTALNELAVAKAQNIVLQNYIAEKVKAENEHSESK